MKTWSTPVTADSQENKKIPCTLCNGSVFLPALTCEGFSFVRCKNCGLVQMNPQPKKEEIIRRYTTMFGKDYLEYELKNEAAFLNLQLLALKDIGFLAQAQESGGAFLDIGCATGALPAFLKECGWLTTGVEISPGAEYAQKKRNLDVRQQPLEEINFPSRSFDVVHASHLIEHLNDPRSFLTEVRRVLKDGGQIYITTPNIAGFQARLFGGKWRSAIYDHLYLFSKRTLTKLLKETGFKVDRIRTWGGLAAGIAPQWLKKSADVFAKFLNCGDVMIIRGTCRPEQSYQSGPKGASGSHSRLCQ